MARSCIRCSRPSSTTTACNAAICTPGFLMLAVECAGAAIPNIGDDELLDVLSSNLCRCTGYQNIIKAVKRPRHMRGKRMMRSAGAGPAIASDGGEGLRAPTPHPRPSPPFAGEREGGATQRRVRMTTAAARLPTPPPASERRVLGHSVPRIEDLPLVTGAAAMPATSTFRTSSTCAWSAPRKAHGRIVSVDTSAALEHARRGRGLDQRRHRRSVADRFPRRQECRPASANSASRRWRRRSCATSAIRSRRCSPRIPISPRTPPSWSTVEIEELPVVMSASDPPGEFEPGRSSEAIVLHHSYGDIEAAFRNAACRGRDRRADRPALRRATGDAWRHRPSTTRRKDLLELHGAAKIPHRNRETLCRMLKRSPSALHVHESHVGGGFGIRGELYPEDLLVLVAAMRLRPAGEMDRGPARTPDVRQPGPRAAPPRAHRGRQGRPSSSASRTRSSTTRAPISAPTASTSRTAPCA